MHLVIGVNEREGHGGTVYNTILYFDANGRLLGNHRKLVPTHADLVVGRGHEVALILGPVEPGPDELRLLVPPPGPAEDLIVAGTRLSPAR